MTMVSASASNWVWILPDHAGNWLRGKFKKWGMLAISSSCGSRTSMSWTASGSVASRWARVSTSVSGRAAGAFVIGWQAFLMY